MPDDYKNIMIEPTEITISDIYKLAETDAIVNTYLNALSYRPTLMFEQVLMACVYTLSRQLSLAKSALVDCHDRKGTGNYVSK